MTHVLFLILAAATACAQSSAPEGNAMPTSIRPRPGDVAIQQELDAARQAGKLEAYDLFLARHPQHPLAETARREREQIARGSPGTPR